VRVSRLADHVLAAIAARAEGVAPGPWRFDEELGCTLDANGACLFECVRVCGLPDDTHRAFIEHAQPDVAALIAEVRRLRALLPEGA
jgi:hypothetical protein